MNICSIRDTFGFVCCFRRAKAACDGIDRGSNDCHISARESDSLLVQDNTPIHTSIPSSASNRSNQRE